MFTKEDFIPLSSRGHGSFRLIASMQPIAADDLFGTAAAQVLRILRDGAASTAANSDADSPRVFVLDNGLAVSVDCQAVRPSHLQCLLTSLDDEPKADPDIRPTGYLLDAAAGLTLWCAEGADTEIRAAASWSLITNGGLLDPLTAMTTPSLYGNKLRLTRFIAPVAYVSVPEGTPVLDLMAGTGITGRSLSDRYPIYPNDANSYAALLAGTHGSALPDRSAADLVTALRPFFQENMSALSALVRHALDEETLFLHGETDESVIVKYAEFLERSVLAHTDGSAPNARLVTERYANIYFGIGQAIEIDSLRYAIDLAFPASSAERDLCLTALILACVACTTGPHFAQPLRSRSVRTLRTTIERRARSVAWEFDLTLARLIARRRPKQTIFPASLSDWRPALERFAEQHQGTPAAVYADPPYSKLQYSRYYHVLNVLLAYDYPPVHGSGRYPPVSSRFSSRFEYQPSVAKREMAELVRRSADLGLTLLLSYGDTGFVAVESLLEMFREAYGRTDAYAERIRHHSQGRTLALDKTTVRERIFVGRP